MLSFTFISLFPEVLEPYLQASMMWKATEKHLAQFDFLNLRDFGLGPHKSVDDTPYGGGDGMLLRPEPVFAAIEQVKSIHPNTKTIVPTPAGVLWCQPLAQAFASQNLAQINTFFSSFPSSSINSPQPSPDTNTLSDLSSTSSFTPPQNPQNLHLTIFCPHYEGFDERIMTIIDYPISLGQYILTGGELPALIIADSIVRLIPGVLGGATSAQIESFSHGDNLEFPQYTKPAIFRDLPVPDVLLSGHHAKIDAWRSQQAKLRKQRQNQP